MKKKLIIGLVILIILVILGILVIRFYRNMMQPIGPGSLGECAEDSYCVPATCCHPTSCVPKPAAPNCEGSFCTMDCKPGTMDCGQGECKCINGGCKAVFN